ncbi:MAG: alcohol dehydrogenase catalytic domain-containing protein [Planctomycetota bacterium]|nr:alcohol dehydrogenase catalytic domain-containing protein [Planctomycetota bacterium]
MTMRGLYLRDGAVSYREDLPDPGLRDGDVEVRVLQAGVCATDLALRRGYMGFCGIPGHEFVGVALDGPLSGKRVVGDINVACGDCPTCDAGDPHHCPHRSVLGILDHGGAFAERLRLPADNLIEVPEEVSDDAATFVEPLAAAFEIVEQVEVLPGQTAVVAGDGRLGLLCAWTLHLAGAEVTVVGRHPERIELLPTGVQHVVGWLEGPGRSTAKFDLAVEASGASSVLACLLPMVRPRGTLVLKTTLEAPTTLNLSGLVIDEIRVVGSRCGPFDKALAALGRGEVPVEPLIEARFPLADGVAALDRAAAGGLLKVMIQM